MITPMFKVDDVICSKVMMGRVQFAHKYDGTWFYVIKQVNPPEQYSVEQIQESDVLYVWIDKQWFEVARWRNAS